MVVALFEGLKQRFSKVKSHHVLAVIMASLLSGSGNPPQSRVEQISIGPLRTQIIHDQPDLRLSMLIFKYRCLALRPGVGSKVRPDDYIKCDEFSMNGAPIRKTEDALDISSKDGVGVDIPKLTVRFGSSEPYFLCFAAKVTFRDIKHSREIPNEIDSEIYQVRSDRYSIASYCTGGALPPEVRGRFAYEHNRVDTLEAFVARLSGPLQVDLTAKRPSAELYEMLKKLK